MGHTGSVHRSRGHSHSHDSRRNPSGTLYGEPVGTNVSPTRAGGSQPNYTQAQMQALYLSRGRPDMAFMSNQSMLPKEIPEMQQTCTVRNHVNLRKNSLKLTSTADDRHAERYNLVFQFDATKPCRVTVFLVAREEIDGETGCSTYSLVQKEAPAITQEFGEGLAQTFSLEQAAATKQDTTDPTAACGYIDFGTFSPHDVAYQNGSSDFPLIVALEVREPDAQFPQSQSTFCTFAKKASGQWEVKVLKQKIQVKGLTYELQEIYGIDGTVAAAAPKTDHGDAVADSDAKHNDEIEIPEGAECIICMCEPRNTTVLPCRHMCLCSECAEALRKSSSTCPICRTRVEALLQIRVDSKEDE